MKRLLLLIVLLPCLAMADKYYLAPPNHATTPGNDTTGDGSISTPYRTLNKAWTVVSAGDTVYMMGGTYWYNSIQINKTVSGSAGSLINIWAYPGEVPIIAKAATYSTTGMDEGLGVPGIYLRGVNYLYFKGITVTGFVQPSGDTQIWRGILAYDVSYSKMERMNITGNAVGMVFAHNSKRNTVLNCDFHHNYDPESSPAYNNGDGLQFSYIDGSAWKDTNWVTGCRSYSNADDGFDCWSNNGFMVFSECWSFRNGYRADGTTTAGDGNGFKFGITASTDTVKRIVTNCISFDNRTRGYDQNQAACPVVMYNNTAYRNGTRSYDFWLGQIKNILTNNIAYGNGSSPIFTDSAVITTCTFLENGSNDPSYTLTAGDFSSLDTAGVTGTRQWDGSLPILDFLKLAAGSDLINTGTDVGLYYNSTAPDLGAFEYFETRGTSTGYVKKGKYVKHLGKLTR